MQGAEFGQFMQEKGYVNVPCWLLEKYQSMDISPEELGYLLLALYRRGRQPDKSGSPCLGSPDEPYPDHSGRGSDPWMGWALEKGWARWEGEGEGRQAVFGPLWQKLYRLWEEGLQEKAGDNSRGAAIAGDFDYSRIVKELDRLRGSLSVTVRDQQMIQEFNLRFGWSTDFILNFFRLCAQRDLLQLKNCKPLAAQIHRAGIYTLEGLTTFMQEVDWTGKQAAEVKRDYLGLYGMVTVVERDYYVKWHITWRFSHALIVRAAMESAGASNATFKYIDSIMARWHELGVDTMEACEDAIRVWREEKAKQGKPGYGDRAPERANGRKKAKEREESAWSGFHFDNGSEG